MNPTQATAPATAQILTVGSTRFAANNRALVSTLFNPDGTANGTFRVRKNGVLFRKPDGDPFAFLVANPGQARFFVSAFKQSDGRLRYSFGLAESDGARLGLAGLKYSATCDEADRVWSQAIARATGGAK